MVAKKPITSESFSQRGLVAWAVNQISLPIKALTDVVRGIKFPESMDVHVENDNSNILLEVAKNTRGLKERLDKFNDKEIKVNAAPVPPLDTKPIAIAVSNLEKTFREIETYETVIVKNLKDIPKTEEVRVSNLKDIKFPDIKTEKTDILPLVKAVGDLKSAFSDLKAMIGQIKPVVNVPPMPKIPEWPKKMEVPAVKDTTDEIVGLRKDVEALYKMMEEKQDAVKVAIEESAASRPTISHSSAAVSSVSINALRGIPKSTSVTVSTSPVLLPDTALTNRRSLIVYNNSSNTVYIGGNDVTTSNGLPIPASSYSPPIDAGAVMKVYAVAGSSSNLRVFEVSSDLEGA